MTYLIRDFGRQALHTQLSPLFFPLGSACLQGAPLLLHFLRPDTQMLALLQDHQEL